MIKNILQNRIGQLALLQSLLFAFSEFFMWSNNSHMFSVEQIVYSSITVIGISIILFFITYYLGKIFLHFFKFKYAELFYAVIITICSSLILDKFFYFSLLNANRHLGMYLSFLLILLCYFFKKVKFLVCFLGILVLLQNVILIKNIINNENESNKIQSKFIQNITTQSYDFIKLQKKPNIYLFWLESYHDFTTMKNIYNIDSSNMNDFLSNHKFNIIEKSYSNSDSTLRSFVDVYSLGEYSSQKLVKGQSDSLYFVRDLIGGNNDNLLYKILKENGYDTWLLLFLDPTYYISTKGKNLDYLNVEIDNKSLKQKLLPIIRFTKYYTNYIDSLYLDEFQGSFVQQVKKAINIAINKKNPYIMSFKGGAFHSFGLNGSLEDSTKWIKSNFYQNSVTNGNYEIKKIVNYIVKHDPNSIIILLGDHGSHAFFGMPYSSMEDLKALPSQYGITPEMLIKDKFSVLMAIRFPNGQKIDIEKNYHISHVNLFIHMLAYLSDDWDLLKLRKESISYGEKSDLPLIKNGEILKIE